MEKIRVEVNDNHCTAGDKQDTLTTDNSPVSELGPDPAATFPPVSPPSGPIPVSEESMWETSSQESLTDVPLFEELDPQARPVLRDIDTVSVPVPVSESESEASSAPVSPPALQRPYEERMENLQQTEDNLGTQLESVDGSMESLRTTADWAATAGEVVTQAIIVFFS